MGELPTNKETEHVTETGPKRRILVRRILALAAAAVLLILAFGAFYRISTYLLTRSYIDEIEQVFDLNKNIANAIVWVTFAVAAILLGYTFSLSRRKRYIGVAGILALLIAHSLVLGYGTMKQNFTRTEGTATKCYIVTRDAIQLREHPGIDPVTGRECRPVTPEIAERVEAYTNGKRPTRIDASEPIFFDPRTGQPIVWYSVEKNGDVELFDLMGFHPQTGEELLPITKDIVARWKTQSIRRTPKRVDDVEKYGPFDPISGDARLWYRAADDGLCEFYDAPGFHPQTGERLLIITREVLTGCEKARRQKKQWYVITRDADHPVRYCDEPGIEQATGRPCREVTQQLLERLREYEKGRRPKAITTADPMFFDLRSGEAVVWYAKDKNGTIEIFDLMGYHPSTGDELIPVTKEVVNEWRQQQKPARAPVSVQFGSSTVLFDPVTGAPRLWFSRKADADYEFFDAPGFNPKSGEPLKSFTKDEATSYLKEVEAKQKREKDEQDRLERERTKRQQEDERKKAELEEKQRNEQRRREQEDNRITEAARRCDDLAANPNDPQKVGAGVEFSILKGQAQEAVKACETAVEQNPRELRFRYQLARALQWSDRRRAFRLHQDLVNQGYRAAYDNLGWMFYMDRHDPNQATILFRKGAQVDDPDAMVSLAEMIERQHTSPAGPSETKLELCRRAAQLGSSAGARCYQAEAAREQEAQQQRATQLQQEKLMMDFVGGVLQSLPRR